MPAAATHFLHLQPTKPITLPPTCQLRLLGRPDDSSVISGAWMVSGGWKDAEKTAGAGRAHIVVAPSFSLAQIGGCSQGEGYVWTQASTTQRGV